MKLKKKTLYALPRRINTNVLMNFNQIVNFAMSNHSLGNNCDNFMEFFREIKKKHMPYCVKKNTNIKINF